jgi:hypothetical protein
LHGTLTPIEREQRVREAMVKRRNWSVLLMSFALTSTSFV